MWKVPVWDMDRPGYEALSRMVGFVYIELSTISAFSVEGSNTDTRTVHDSGPKRGGFAPGCLTIHDMRHYRGGFAPGY